MIFEKAAVLDGIGNLQAQEDFAIAERFLRSDGLVPFTTRIAKLSAGTTKRIWKTRLWNSVRINKKFFGCAAFVAKLDLTEEDVELAQFSFKNDTMTGIFWFRGDSDEPMGFVIVEIDPSRPKQLHPEFTEPPESADQLAQSQILDGLLGTEVTYKNK